MGLAARKSAGSWLFLQYWGDRGDSLWHMIHQGMKWWLSIFVVRRISFVFRRRPQWFPRPRVSNCQCLRLQAYRYGQKKPVFVYRLLATGCIEHKIFLRQTLKKEQSGWVLDGSKSSQSDVHQSGEHTWPCTRLQLAHNAV